MHELSHPFHQPQRPHNRGRLLTVNNIPQFLPQSTHCHCSSACYFQVSTLLTHHFCTASTLNSPSTRTPPSNCSASVCAEFLSLLRAGRATEHGFVAASNKERQRCWKAWTEWCEHHHLDPELRTDDLATTVATLQACTAFVRQGSVGRGQQVGAQAVQVALRAIGAHFELDARPNPCCRNSTTPTSTGRQSGNKQRATAARTPSHKTSLLFQSTSGAGASPKASNPPPQKSEPWAI
jgi:hypothetical protein